MPDHELVLLAALIADGNLTQNTPRFCLRRGFSGRCLSSQLRPAGLGARLNVPAKGHGDGDALERTR